MSNPIGIPQGFEKGSTTAISTSTSRFMGSPKPQSDCNCGHIDPICLQFPSISRNMIKWRPKFKTLLSHIKHCLQREINYISAKRKKKNRTNLWSKGQPKNPTICEVKFIQGNEEGHTSNSFDWPFCLRNFRVLATPFKPTKQKFQNFIGHPHLCQALHYWK